MPSCSTVWCVSPHLVSVAIDRDSPIPLYHQLSEQLSAAISSGTVRPDRPGGIDPLPGISCMAEVLRPTSEGNVRITSAEEHDREMAYVQALTHLIGRSLAQMQIPDEKLKTQTYQHLIDLTGLIGNDSFELFTAIQTMNPFAPDVVEDFVARASALLDQVRA